MDLQQIATRYCELKEFASLVPQVRCNSDGTVCIPNAVSKCGSCDPIDLLTLAMIGSEGGSNELLQQILDALQQQPQAEAGGYELLCKAGTDDGYYLLRFVYDEEAGTSETQWIDEAGVEGVGLPPDAVRCPDTDVVQTCFADRTDANNPAFYTQVVYLKAGQILEVLWVDSAGAILATAPANVERCETEPWQAVEVCVNGTEAAIAHITDSGSVLGVFNFNGATYQAFPDPIANISVGVCPVATRTASFSSEMTLGGADGTVPANTYAITAFNDTNDTIQVAIGADVQIIPRRSSYSWSRDYETEQPFAAGPAVVTTLSGTTQADERVIFNYKEIG